MQIGRLGRIVIASIPGFVLWFLLSGADSYLWQAGILPIRPALVKAGVLLPVFIMLVVIQLLKDGGVRLVSLYRDNAPLLIAVFFLALVQTVWSFHPGAYWDDGGYLAFRQLALFVLVLLVIPLVLVPGLVEHYRLIVLSALGVFLITVVIDFLNPGTYSSTGIGAAGWAENPNHSAAAVTALAILAVDWYRYRKADWLLWGIVGGLVVLTGSRSGLIMWAFGVIFWYRHHFSGLFRFAYIFIGFMLFAVLMAAVIHFSSSEQFISDYLMSKFISFTDWELLTQGERITLISYYLEFIGQRPLAGHGAWFWMRDGIGAHNVYLMLWASNGLPGLISYLLLVILILYNSRRLADKRTYVMVFVIFLLQGLFSHMLVVRDLFFVALALAAGLAWSQQARERLVG